MKGSVRFSEDEVPVSDLTINHGHFQEAVAQGLIDVEEGRTVSLAEARKRLGVD